MSKEFRQGSNSAEFRASEFAFGKLYSAMVISGIPDNVAGAIVRHERLHYLADPFRDGATGFYRSGDSVTGYYIPHRVSEMTPQERKGMVEIVGGEASGADRNFWDAAHSDQLIEDKEAYLIAGMIIDTISRLNFRDEAPGWEDIFQGQSQYVVDNYGHIFRKAYEDSLSKLSEPKDDYYIEDSTEKELKSDLDRIEIKWLTDTKVRHEGISEKDERIVEEELSNDEDRDNKKTSDAITEHVVYLSS